MDSSSDILFRGIGIGGFLNPDFCAFEYFW
jgi:hypothetical protein